MKNKTKIVFIAMILLTALTISSCQMIGELRESLTGTTTETTSDPLDREDPFDVEDPFDGEDPLDGDDIFDDFERKLEEAGYSSVGVSKKIPEGMSDNWRDFQFGYLGETYDLLGKKLSDVLPGKQRITYDNITEILPGETIPVGIDIAGYPVDSATYAHNINLEVMNMNNTISNIEDCIIESVSISSEIFPGEPLDMGLGVDFKMDTSISYVLPGGIVPLTEVAEAQEVWGEPDEIVQSLMDEKHIYREGDKSLIVSIIMGTISEFSMYIDLTPVFVTEINNRSTINDFSTTIDDNTYLNIGGFHLTMGMRCQDVFDGLNLIHIVGQEETDIDFTTAEIQPYEELTIRVMPMGFGTLNMSLRLYNPAAEPVILAESKVIGVNVIPNESFDIINLKTLSFDDTTDVYYPYNSRFTMPVIAPFDIRLNENHETFWAKIPDDSYEKVKAEDGGYYAELRGGNNRIYIGSYVPLEAKEEVVLQLDEIMFTVIDKALVTP